MALCRYQGDGVYRIVYEEVSTHTHIQSCLVHVMVVTAVCTVCAQVSEGKVEEVHTFNPSRQAVDSYQYPRPGVSIPADDTL